MCLVRITRRIPATARGFWKVRKGWKIVYDLEVSNLRGKPSKGYAQLWYSVTGKLNFAAKIPTQRWHKSTAKRIRIFCPGCLCEDMCDYTYKSGFHIFPAKKAAMKYRAGMLDKKGKLIVPVFYTQAETEGTDSGETKVVVANYVWYCAYGTTSHPPLPPAPPRQNWKAAPKTQKGK